MKLFSFIPATIFLSLCSALLAETKPNIVVVISDDHSQLDSQAYGSGEVRTPHMAKLAAEGLKFTQAFVASPSCGPSRTALLTGLWPARNGAERNHTAKRPEVRSLPTLLRAIGYEVAVIGKVAHNDWAKLYDFDFVDGPSLGLTGTAGVAKFLSERQPAKPLCLFVGLHHPHTPWSAEPTYAPAAVQIPPTHVDTEVTRVERTRYLTDISKSDTLLGEVRALAREKIPGDTLFIYTADHGGAWPFGKWSLYDAGIRIPLLIAWPGKLQPATTSDAMVCWPDLLPTFIDLAGGQVPSGIDGKSFAPILRGTATTHRERIFATHSGDGDFNVYPIRTVRTPDWKYIRNLHPEFQYHTHISRSSGPSGLLYWKTWLEAAKTETKAAATVKRYSERPAEELYDLKADPLELHNLASGPQHAQRLATMRSDLTVWMKEQGDQETVFGTPLLQGQPVKIIERSGGGRAHPSALPLEAPQPGINNVTVRAGAPAEQSQALSRAEDLLLLDNGTVKIGINRAMGASITSLSWTGYPHNAINSVDPGRLIQQSYYAGRVLDRQADGQHQSWSPWSWNPIQGGGVGSWARVTQFRRLDDHTLFGETIPKLWDMPDEEAAAVMRQWTGFEPDMPEVMVVRCELTCQRPLEDRWGPAKVSPQEIPACYFTRNFSTIKSYLGNGQWRGERQPPGPPWGKAEPPLKAMACFNSEGQGIAIFSPAATLPWNFGPHGSGASADPASGPCVHVAPIAGVNLGPKSIFRYRYWLAVGTEAKIASRLDALRERHGNERAELIDP